MTAERGKLPEDDYARLADFRHALRVFLQFSENAAREQGLTPQKHQALLAIRGNSNPPTSVGYLAERLLIRPNTAAELGQRLERDGLITRRVDEDDRRTINLQLTKLGESKLEELSYAHLRELSRLKGSMLASIDQSEVERSQ